MSRALQLLQSRKALARSVASQIDRLHATDAALLMALQAEAEERQTAILTALGESDDMLITRLLAKGEEDR